MRILAPVAAAVLACSSVAYAGFPLPNLAGTWEGKLTCKGIGNSFLFFGPFTFSDKEATLEIFHADDDEIRGSLEADDPDFPVAITVSPMCGPVVADPEKPEKARAGLVVGNTPPGSTFAVDFQSVKVFPPNSKGVTGKLKGKGVLLGSGVGAAVSGACKWSFERTSETPPSDPGSCETEEF